MPRRSAFRRAMLEYLAEVRETRAPSTAECYEDVLRRLERAVDASGTTTYITRWTVEDVRRVLAQRAHLLPNSYLHEVTVLRNMLNHAGVAVMERELKARRLRMPRPVRFHVRWYGEKTLATIRAACRSDVEYVSVILASELGLRRAEIAALQLQDIQGDSLLIRGAKGGKVLPVPLTMSVAATLDAWIVVRREMVLKAISFDPSTPIPEEVLVWQRGPKVRPYSPKTISDIIRSVGRRIGIKLSPHDLRRSCGRELYLVDHDLIPVNRLLRHESLDMTRLYIGADLEDARVAMEARDAKRRSIAPIEVEPVVRPL